MTAAGAVASAVLILGGAARAQDANTAYKSEFRKGTDALQQSQLDEAIGAFKRAAKSPDARDAAAAYVGMAVAYYRQGEFKKSIESCDAALKRTVDDRVTEAQARNVRGFSLSAMAKDAGDKKLKEAEAEYRAAIAASDAVPSARFNLGKTLLRMNRDDEGVAELKAFLQRESSGSQAAEAGRLIENPNRARGNFAPDFSFTSRAGEQISLASLQGKAVLLDFWGSWCGPCVQATPGLGRIAKKFEGRPLVILGIAQDRREAWNAFIEKHKMNWPQYLDESREIADLFGIRGYPTYIIIDPEGILRGHRMGYGAGTEGWIESEIKKALNLKEGKSALK